MHVTRTRPEPARSVGDQLAATATEPAGRSPSSAVGTSLVSRAVSAETEAISATTAVKIAVTTQPPTLTPPSAVTIVGAKPATRKPSWVPIATPENRTFVVNISP